MSSFKNDINEAVGRYILHHIEKENLDVGQVQALNKFWETIGPLILNEIVWKLDEIEDAAGASELQDLLDFIEAASNIDKEDINTKNIIKTIKDFIEELEQEVDFEDTEGLED